MKNETIKKSISINSPKEKVWNVLIDDTLTRIWYAEFSPGTHAQTDWTLDSKVIFADDSHNGMVGKIVANDPYSILSVEHQGEVRDGKEDYESEAAKQIKGALETYRLSEQEGITQLSIDCDMAEAYVEQMSLAWDKALLKIKELSEND